MNVSLKKNKLLYFIERNTLLLLAVCWIIVQGYLYKSAGILTTGESTKVIREATNLSEGRGLSESGYYLYFTEIFLVYLKIKTGLGYGMVVLIQMIMNLAALLVFFRFLAFTYSSKIIGFTGGLLLLICFPYQEYNTFLYTESLFFSLSVIYSCWLLRQKKITVKKISEIILFLFLLCITRPSGVFFVAATFVYLLCIIRSSFPVKAIVFAGASVLSLILLNYIIGGGGTLDLMLPFRKEMIICEVPTGDAVIGTSGDDNSLHSLFYYITHNFSHFAGLAFWKTKCFFGLTRSYYSKGHNIFIAVFFYSLYALILLAAAKFRRKLSSMFIYIAMLTTAFWFSVMLSCDEWHSRFFLTLTPFLIMAALYLFKKTEARAQ